MPNKPVGKEFSEWSKTPLGETIGVTEFSLVKDAVNSVPGVRILQIGTFPENETILVNRKVNYYIIDPFDRYDRKVSLVANPSDLPYQDESIDIVILLHSLEFSSKPQRVLHEAERVLSPDGYLIVVGYNPLSFFGIKRFFCFRYGKAPWRGHYFSIRRIKDWFAVLSLDTAMEKRFFYRPPVRSKSLLKRLVFMERFMEKWLSWSGGVYLIMARKRVLPLSLLRSNWLKRKKKIISSGVAQPAPKSSSGKVILKQSDC